MRKNTGDLWRQHLPVPDLDSHKYKRGHAVVLGAHELTGATRLAAEACSRIGAGLVTVLAERNADLYRTTLAPDVMVSERGLSSIRQARVVLAGCGGATSSQIETLRQASAGGAALVLDAAAIAPFKHFDCDGAERIFTPHEGEFAAVFPKLMGSRVDRAMQAAALTKAVIVLKGPQTIIARPGREAVINGHASPYLAKAGTGDVLAGMIAGLVAQDMACFEAACAAVWMHGEASRLIGPGLVASDIVGQIPGVLRRLL